MKLFKSFWFERFFYWIYNRFTIPATHGLPIYAGLLQNAGEVSVCLYALADDALTSEEVKGDMNDI
ncbi:hypothetical protein [Undibacterium sp. TC9W]|uniref:hypothetical protein n=1 Tax=Undibacterium sp. TC9W TaxID=3413053 RepID=UPI003BF0E1F5